MSGKLQFAGNVRPTKPWWKNAEENLPENDANDAHRNLPIRVIRVIRGQYKKRSLVVTPTN